MLLSFSVSFFISIIRDVYCLGDERLFRRLFGKNPFRGFEEYYAAFWFLNLEEVLYNYASYSDFCQTIRVLTSTNFRMSEGPNKTLDDCFSFDYSDDGSQIFISIDEVLLIHLFNIAEHIRRRPHTNLEHVFSHLEDMPAEVNASEENFAKFAFSIFSEEEYPPLP